MKTAKELELSLLLKESHIQQLNLKINNLQNELDDERRHSREYGMIIINAMDYILELMNYDYNKHYDKLLEILENEVYINRSEDNEWLYKKSTKI